jgi:hypothetical protein
VKIVLLVNHALIQALKSSVDHMPLIPKVQAHPNACHVKMLNSAQNLRLQAVANIGIQQQGLVSV